METAPITPATEAPETQAPVDAAKPEETAPKTEPKEKDQFSEKLELLAKKERILARERMRMAQEKKDLEEKLAKYQAWEEKKAKAKQKPFDYLNEAGLTYDELTQYVLNGGASQEEAPDNALRGELERLKQEIESFKESQTKEKEQQQTYAQQQAIENFKTEIKTFIDEHKDTYELIAQRDATEEIFQSIADAYTLSMQEWERNGQYGPQPQPMPIEEAAKLLEEFYEQEVKRLVETNKWKSKYGGPAPKAEEPKKGPSPTLTNQMAATSSAASVLPAKTENDRIRRALEKLGG